MKTIQTMMLYGLALLPAMALHAAYETELAAVAALGDLTTAPTMYTDDTLPGTLATVAAGDLKIIYYDVLDYAGNPTRACAWIGVPSGASAVSPVPGMVLVHGGGGTASQAWVQKWTERGYAAISIAVEGQTNVLATQAEKDAGLASGKWLKHAMAGPRRSSLYTDSPDTITDQWMYHAVADTVLANSLLRSLPEVDATKVGLSGYSWGGVITSTVIGIDNRFMFAIPTYGCGHKYDSRNYYGANLANNESYKQVWDPMVRIANATMPVLWLSWPEDPHFLMDSLAYTYYGAPGTRMVSLRPSMGHGGNFDSPEYYDYADDMVSGAGPWSVQQSINLTGNTATVVFHSTKTLNTASLVYTIGNDEITGGIDINLIWTEIAADSLVESPTGTWTVTATLPAGVTGWFVNTKATGSDTGDLYGYVDSEIIASSDYQEVIDLSLSPAASLAIEHPLAEDQSSGTVDMAFSGPANVEISSITISGVYADSFSSLTAAPLVLLTPTPDTTPVTIQFDNTVAGLTEGQTATATLTIVWDELDGSTDQISLPLSATAVAALTVVHDASADWDSQNVNSIDHVILQNDATVTVGEFVEPNLVVGGSFEAPDVADGIASGLVAGNGTLTGWAITAAGVTVIDSWNNGGGIDPAPVGSDGEQFLQLQRHPDGAGTISQTLATEDGATYQLTFDYSGIYPGTSETTITYNVGGDAQSVDLTLVNGQVPWASETFEFTATAGGTVLGFTGEKVAGFWGASIDNVSVTVLPATSDAADTIIVNDGPSPTTATLNIHQDYSLTATTSIELGVGTGAGFVNQSTGTVTTADLAINESGTGDTSQYNLSGGELSVSNVISINANGALNQTGGTISGSGTIANNGSFSYNSTANQTLSGVISGAGSVTKDNTGTLTISNHGTYSGATTILGGTLKLSGSQKRNLATSYTVEGASAVLEAANIQVFSAFGSSYDKELTATNGGTIKATSVAIRIGDVTLQNGSRLTANGVNGTYGGCYIGQLAGGASPTVTVTGSGASQIDGIGNMTLVSTIFDVEDVTGDNAADLTVSLNLQNMTGINFTGNVQIDGAVTKTGAGTLTLSATNSYTGATTVSAGILSLGNGTNNTALDDAADMIVTTGAVVNLNYTGTDTIDELSLGGALQTPGIWGASGSGATFINDSFFSGGGTLTVTIGPAPSAYQGWSVGNGLSDADALTTADPESDGLSNLLEFAFGTDPTVSNGSSIAYGNGVTPGLPLPVLESITSESVDFRAVFAWRKEWAAAGLTYTVQFSADLSEWVDSAETPTLLESGSGDIDAVYVDFPLIIQTTTGFEKAQFFRLSVSQD
jgi:autotransporter-associated beta strand protein